MQLPMTPTIIVQKSNLDIKTLCQNNLYPISFVTNCRRFGPEGPSTEPTSEFNAVCPCPDGLAQDGTQGGMHLVLSRTGGARCRGYKRRERERERESRDSRLLPPRAPAGRPWTSPFIDVRRASRCTMGV
jgi:hypothetical protein